MFLHLLDVAWDRENANSKLRGSLVIMNSKQPARNCFEKVRIEEISLPGNTGVKYKMLVLLKMGYCNMNITSKYVLRTLFVLFAVVAQ